MRRRLKAGLRRAPWSRPGTFRLVPNSDVHDSSVVVGAAKNAGTVPS